MKYLDLALKVPFSITVFNDVAMFRAVSPAHVGFESLSSVVVTEIELLSHEADS